MGLINSIKKGGEFALISANYAAMELSAKLTGNKDLKDIVESIRVLIKECLEMEKQNLTDTQPYKIKMAALTKNYSDFIYLLSQQPQEILQRIKNNLKKCGVKK